MIKRVIVNHYFISLVLVIVILVSYVVGLQVDRAGFAIALNQSQGELAFNHLKNYESLKEDLEMNCNKTATNKLDGFIQMQKVTLVEIINTFRAGHVRDYISIRDEALLEELSAFEVNLGGILFEDDC